MRLTSVERRSDGFIYDAMRAEFNKIRFLFKMTFLCDTARRATNIRLVIHLLTIKLLGGRHSLYKTFESIID